MLDPITELLLLVGGLYVFECLRWVSPWSVGIRSVVPGRWRVVSPRRIGTHWKRAVLPAAPWPPFGAVYVADELPFRISEKGLLVGSVRPEGRTLAAVDDEVVSLDRIRIEGTELCVDGRPRQVHGTRRLAGSVRSLLSDLRRQGRDEKRLQRFFDARFDVNEARARLEAWRRASAPLVVACNLLFVALAATLVAVIRHPIGWRLFLPLGALALLWVTTAVLFEWTSRRVLPKAIRPPVGRRVVTMLSPLSLVRAHDELRCELLGDLDPLAVASVLLPPRLLRVHARAELAGLTFPLTAERPTDDPVAEAIEAADRARHVARIHKLLQENGIDPDELLGAAPSEEAGEQAWCPRCRATFAGETTTCSSCRGVRLRPLVG